MSRKEPRKRCDICSGSGVVYAFWQIGETGVVPLVPCPCCHGTGEVALKAEVS